MVVYRLRKAEKVKESRSEGKWRKKKCESESPVFEGNDARVLPLLPFLLPLFLLPLFLVVTDVRFIKTGVIL